MSYQEDDEEKRGQRKKFASDGSCSSNSIERKNGTACEFRSNDDEDNKTTRLLVTQLPLHKKLEQKPCCYYNENQDNINSSNKTFVNDRKTNNLDVIIDPVERTKEKEQRNDEESSSEEEETLEEPSIILGIMHGLISSCVLIPWSMGAATVVYEHPIYQPYIATTLMKLTLWCSAVHQLCFSLLSHMPFAHGQIQNAGLIFASHMATTIANEYSNNNNNNHDDDDDGVKDDGNNNDYNNNNNDLVVLATSTILLPIFNAIMGLVIVVIARFKLATFIQVMLPTPVVGGYLAYLGYFLSQVALNSMSNLQVHSILEWYQYFNTIDMLTHVVPGIVGGAIMYVSAKQFRTNPFVIPICAVGMFILFYSVLAITRTTIQQARDDNWITSTTTKDSSDTYYSNEESYYGSSSSSSQWLDSVDINNSQFFNTWQYFNFNLVDWSIMPRLIPSLIGLITTVALNSSLDIMTIKCEFSQILPNHINPIDIDKELEVVGWCNVGTGSMGGYFGSFNVSQTIFNIRGGILHSRIPGFVLALIELIVVLSPINPIGYIPTFFFGSLLIMIGMALLIDWLWMYRPTKVNTTTIEQYISCLISFLLILFLGIEFGILLAAVSHFLLAKCGFNVNGNHYDEQSKNSHDNKEEHVQPSQQKLKNEDVDGSRESGSEYQIL